MTGVSIKTEVASRFKKSNQLYAPPENIEMSKPCCNNVISSILGTKLTTEKSVFFTKENVAFYSLIKFYQPHNQLPQHSTLKELCHEIQPN